MNADNRVGPVQLPVTSPRVSTGSSTDRDWVTVHFQFFFIQTQPHLQVSLVDVNKSMQELFVSGRKFCTTLRLKHNRTYAEYNENEIKQLSLY